MQSPGNPGPIIYLLLARSSLEQLQNAQGILYLVIVKTYLEQNLCPSKGMQHSELGSMPWIAWTLFPSSLEA